MSKLNRTFFVEYSIATELPVVVRRLSEKTDALKRRVDRALDFARFIKNV